MKMEIQAILIHIDEMETEFYLFFSVAEQLTQISFETKIQPYYSRNVLESILDSNLYHIIKKDGQGFSSMMEEEGRPGNSRSCECCKKSYNGIIR